MSDSLAALIAQAKQLASEKRFEECSKVFSELLQLHPKAPEVHSALANVMVDLGHVDVGLAILADSVDQSNPDVNTLKTIIHLLRGYNRLDEAADLLLGAVAAAPDDQELRAEAHTLFESLGRLHDLEEFLNSGTLPESATSTHPEAPSH